ncbi:hypothetical protein IV203_033759 [Nitzschia inconspicua]|uniref:t-SNARE coiled-coil homology domain-containing protein n=1 Tax=Nitzschia inconspicua TaxID=303405 RepID=A0A9K3M4C5_9STRA|nr:hypothetical protein IV203_033759 [Nitzschia inconspicua]
MSFQDIGRAAMAMVGGDGTDRQTPQPHPSVSSSSRKLRHRSHDETRTTTTTTTRTTTIEREHSRKSRSTGSRSKSVPRQTSSRRRETTSTKDSTTRRPSQRPSNRSRKEISEESSATRRRDSHRPSRHTHQSEHSHPKSKNRVQPVTSPSSVSHHIAPPTRGVRPRLDHLQCPVSEKKLMDDITEYSHSVLTADDSTAISSENDDDDGWSGAESASECLFNPRTNERSTRQQLQPSTIRPNSKSKSTSQFAKLSTEIVQFQKMVAELEVVLQHASSSPEAMWRSRILMRSAQDSQRDLQRQIHQVDFASTANHNPRNKAHTLAQQKLQRDWKRAQQHFHKILMESQRQQLAELSLLGAKGDLPTARYASSSSYPMLQEEKEDFFDRAMRERQEEIERISKSMNQINDIYSDLAGLVDAQQEQIDKLEDINDDTKARTKAGLEQIQYTMWKMCASTEANANADGNRGATSTVMWNMCAGQERNSRSFEETTSMPPNPHDPFTNHYRGRRSAPVWKIPTDLESIKVHVKDSAQGAYTIGQALVEDLMDQVEDVARSNNMESPRKTLRHAQKQFAKHLSCAPDLQATCSSGTMEGNDIRSSHPNSQGGNHTHDLYYGSSQRVGEMKEYE